MTERQNPAPPHATGDEEIARLLELAGPRAAVPLERSARVKSAIADEWRRSVRARRRARRVWFAGGLAAAAAAAAMLGPLLPRALVEPDPMPAAVVAVGEVERLHGGAEVADAAGGAVLPGRVVTTESRLSTGADGRLALRLAAGHSVRLDVDSRLRFDSPLSLVLERGALYVSSDGATLPLRVHTPLGRIDEIGTRFEVRLAPDRVRVRVREGAIALHGDEEAFDAVAGGELLLTDQGDVVRSRIPVDGEPWEWVWSITPGFEIEGQPLDAFLAWVTDETGWEISFEGASRATAGEIVLHGSIAELTVAEALAAVLPTCGFDHRIEDGVLHLMRRRT